MEKNIYERNYESLLPYIKDMIGTRKDYKRFTAGECFMPLVIEKLQTKESGVYIISITHYYPLNGDLMKDPDMELEVNINEKTVEALSYQQDNVGLYQTVYFEKDGQIYVRPQLKKSLNEFLEMWLNNIKNQGYTLEEKVNN